MSASTDYARAVRGARARRGGVTILTLIAVPLLLTVLCVVAEINHVWRARAQFENALEAAALAGVKQWGEQGGGESAIPTARDAAKAYALANTIQGQALDFDDPAVVPASDWQFGTAVARDAGFDFTPARDASENQALLLTATARVAPLWRFAVGNWIGDSTMTVTVAAYYDKSATPPHSRLIRLNRPASPAPAATVPQGLHIRGAEPVPTGN